ncbi:unnamed protein product, partial [Pylaiella littoralis]
VFFSGSVHPTDSSSSGHENHTTPFGAYRPRLTLGREGFAKGTAISRYEADRDIPRRDNGRDMNLLPLNPDVNASVSLDHPNAAICIIL